MGEVFATWSMGFHHDQNYTQDADKIAILTETSLVCQPIHDGWPHNDPLEPNDALDFLLHLMLTLGCQCPWTANSTLFVAHLLVQLHICNIKYPYTKYCSSYSLPWVSGTKQCAPMTLPRVFMLYFIILWQT